MIFNNPDLVCAFSNKDDQNMALAYGDISNVLLHRNNFLKRMNINYRDLICAKQVHGNNVEFVSNEDRGKGAALYETAIAGTDALITNQSKLPLAIFTADCLPLYIYDSVNKGIGMVHAGWRGSQKNIAGKTLDLMQEKFKTKPEDVLAGFGPALRSCCYEVGAEFKNIFSLGILEKGGSFYLDLVEINRRQLTAKGVNPNNIEDSWICTACQNKDYFSYRREGKSAGRILNVIMLID